MVLFQDLPEEVIGMILTHVDLCTLLNFSEVCQQFKRYCRDSQVVKFAKYDGRYPITKPWPTWRKFLNLNRMYITHLNLNYAHWLNKREFLKCLEKLSCLEDLNIVGTGVLMRDIQKIAQDLKKLSSISVSYNGGQFIIGKIPFISQEIPAQLDKVHVFLDTLHLNQFCFRIWRGELDIKCLQVEWLNCPYFGNPPIPLTSLLDVYKGPELILDNLSMPIFSMQYLMSYAVYMRFRYVFIETSNQIFLSEGLCPELEDDTFVVRLEFLQQPEWNTYRNIMCLYLVRPDCSVAAMEHFIRKRYKIKREWRIMPPSSVDQQPLQANAHIAKEVALFGRIRSVLQHIYDTGPYKQMIFNEEHFLTDCPQSLADKVVDAPASECSLPYKKRRVSHAIVSNILPPSVFEKSLNTNKTIVSLNIIATTHKTVYKTMKRWSVRKDVVYNLEGLYEIAKLENLKHLSINLLPNDSNNFAKLVLKNCRELESLQVASNDVLNVEAFSKHMYLSKKMKTVLLQSAMTQIDTMLMNLSSVPTLETVALVDLAPDYRPKCKISKAALVHILDKCKKLAYLNIYQEGIPATWKAANKKKEMSLKKMYKNLYVQMTEPFFINFFGKSHYNVHFPTK